MLAGPAAPPLAAAGAAPGQAPPAKRRNVWQRRDGASSAFLDTEALPKAKRRRLSVREAPLPVASTPARVKRKLAAAAWPPEKPLKYALQRPARLGRRLSGTTPLLRSPAPLVLTKPAAKKETIAASPATPVPDASRAAGPPARPVLVSSVKLVRKSRFHLMAQSPLGPQKSAPARPTAQRQPVSAAAYGSGNALAQLRKQALRWHRQGELEPRQPAPARVAPQYRKSRFKLMRVATPRAAADRAAASPAASAQARMARIRAVTSRPPHKRLGAVPSGQRPGRAAGGGKKLLRIGDQLYKVTVGVKGRSLQRQPVQARSLARAAEVGPASEFMNYLEQRGCF